CHSWYVRLLSPDPFLAMSLARESERAFEETGNPYNVTMSKLLLGVTEADLGDIMGGERTLREGLVLASRLSHGFLLINTQMNLVLALAERPEPELLAEGYSLAQLIVDAGVSPIYAASAHTARARIMLVWGRAAEAEEASRKACEIFSLA